MRVLLDSNVLLDVLLDRKPFSESSNTVYQHCIFELHSGYVTPLTLATVYYLLQKALGRGKAILLIREIVQTIDILTMNRESVFAALDSDFSDFEDALQYASALNDSNIEAIITRNTRDFTKSRIPVYSPEEFLTHLSA